MAFSFLWATAFLLSAVAAKSVQPITTNCAAAAAASQDGAIQWYSENANHTFILPSKFEEDDSFIVIDAPALWNDDTNTCTCPKQLQKFNYWVTNATIDRDSEDCDIECARCVVLMCVNNYVNSIHDTFNVLIVDGKPTCVLAKSTATASKTASKPPETVSNPIETVSKTVTQPTATAKPVPTVTESCDCSDAQISVGVDVEDGDYNYKYSYKYPEESKSIKPSVTSLEP